MAGLSVLLKILWRLALALLVEKIIERTEREKPHWFVEVIWPFGVLDEYGQVLSPDAEIRIGDKVITHAVLFDAGVPEP